MIETIHQASQVQDLTRSRSIPQSWWSIKRAIDIVVATAALLITSPLLLATAVAVTLVSPGSPIFLQTRVGKDGRTFKLFKFRTMDHGAHLLHEQMLPFSEVDGPVFKLRDDPRLHRLGAVLRRTSIDELPNFFNVLRGEMSVVGPRPPLPSEVEHYDERALRRLCIKPGITCLWQINGRSNVTFDHWMELDNEYINTWTPMGDLAIIARTIPAVIRGSGAH